MDSAPPKTVSFRFRARSLLLLCSALLTSCVSYEPAVLVPEITLSPAQMSLRGSESDAEARVDFGVEVAVNESDSLFNVQTLPGVVVRGLAEDGPAANAGIQVGDVILAIDGTEVNQPDAVRALEREPGGSAREFRVRRGTTVFQATVIPREVASNPPPEELFRLDPIASRAGYRSEVLELADGRSLVAAEVVEMAGDSPLPAAGLNVGDLILAVNNEELSSAQDLVTRLVQDYELGETVTLSVWKGNEVTSIEVPLWDPGRRISRIALGPLLQYEAELSPPRRSLSIIDLWLFAVYRYQQVDGERSHSLLGLFNFTSDYGALVEE